MNITRSIDQRKARTASKLGRELRQSREDFKQSKLDLKGQDEHLADAYYLPYSFVDRAEILDIHRNIEPDAVKQVDGTGLFALGLMGMALGAKTGNAGLAIRGAQLASDGPDAASKETPYNFEKTLSEIEGQDHRTMSVNAYFAWGETIDQAGDARQSSDSLTTTSVLSGLAAVAFGATAIATGGIVPAVLGVGLGIGAYKAHKASVKAEAKADTLSQKANHIKQLEHQLSDYAAIAIYSHENIDAYIADRQERGLIART